MNRVWVLPAVFLFASIFGALPSAIAQCRGADMFEQFRAEDPASHARLAETAAREYGPSGRLFRVSNKDGAISHLFGTMHLADTRITTLPDAVSEAFKNSNVLVVEIADFEPPKDLASVARFLKSTIANRDDALVSYLSPEELARVREGLAERGVARNGVDVFRPWVITARWRFLLVFLG